MLKAIHDSVTGRTRFKVAGLYRGELLKRHLEEELGKRKCISAVKASILTGNLLVRYNSDATLSSIESLILQKVHEYHIGRATAPNIAKPPGNNPSSFPLKKDRDCAEDSPHPKAVPPRDNKRSTPLKQKEQLSSLPIAGTGDPSSHHAQSIRSVLNKYGVRKNKGLHPDEARKRLREYGSNLLPESRTRSSWDILKEQFYSGPVALLSVAAGVSVLTGGVVEAAAIMAVVGLNAAIGYVTESQSERTINSLKNMVTPWAHVLRDGKVDDIEVQGLVPGDMIALHPGDYVGADARIIEATRLSIDESTLTGESIPVKKTVNLIKRRQIPLADRQNMCYMGTLVTGGQGTAVVVNTGARTEMGHIQRMVDEAKSPDTPMSQQLDSMGRQMAWVASGMCLLVFLIGLLRGTGFFNMLTTSISLAVAAVPEGLPSVATTALAMGIRRMKSRGVLIRHLGAIEALGATQVMCLDKTGTITANRMTIVQLHAGDATILCPPEKRLIIRREEYFSHELPLLIVAVALCNESETIKKDDAFQLAGSPTENALARLAIDSGIDLGELKQEYVLLKMYHRSENRNFMISLHRNRERGTIAAVKGSPSEVLNLCSHWMIDGQVESMTAEKRLQLQVANERMAGEALRVLGVAVGMNRENVKINDVDGVLGLGYIWVGMVGMTDPIRSGVRDLMDQFHEAGIKTVMITGDQSATAYTVGRQLALNGGKNLQILDSSTLASMDPETLAALCEQTNVFARVSPAHKLRIVEAYQRSGKVVAMTGDGINDGPALKKADIGVAMGRTGTDVAREISDVVLEDDQLETMIVAVEEGRTIYLNVRKTLHFLLATNFSEIIVSFAANATGMGQPLTQMQLLWINMISDIFPGLALSLERAEEDILRQPPRDPDEPILRRQDLKKICAEAGVISTGAIACYAYGLSRYGVGPRATSLSFLSLTLGQLLHAYHCRSEKHSIFAAGALQPNKYLNWAMGGSFALQAIAMFVPGLRSLLGIQGMGVIDALVVGGTAVAPLLINDTFKRSRSRSEKPQTKSLASPRRRRPRLPT